jgi:hypothetical protein
MDIIALLFFVVNAVALWAVPRKYAPVPLLAGCCYMTLGQGIELGPISLPIFRMLMAVGLLRILVKGETIVGGFNKIDKIMIALAAWLFFASFFHDGIEGSGPIYILGFLFNLLLTYFLIRIWTRTPDEVEELIKIIAILLVPVAVAMMVEVATAKNLFAIFGGVPENSQIREGKLRAQGPFRHPILAGTVGGTCVALFIGIFRTNRKIAILGIVSGVAIVFASASSGPVMSLLISIGAMVMWKFKYLVRPMVMAGLGLYFVLMLVMERPPYYLISKIDITGGSTGWHRSFLIEQTFKHLSEWWLFGTDRTRHWMPSQGAITPHHTDITNYYIVFGVMGGLVAMLLVVYAIIVGIRWVCAYQEEPVAAVGNNGFMVWGFGAALFSHAVSSISVAYFDQSVIFFWMTLAAISSVYSTIGETESEWDGETIENDADPPPMWTA